MKGPITNYVGWLLLAGVFGFYVYGLGLAIDLSWTGNIAKGSYPAALSTAISSIQALLLTNLGALLGISVTNRQSSVAHALLLHGPSTAGGGGAGAAQFPAPPDPLALREKVQLAALVLYILGLLAYLITWGHADFVSDDSRIVDLVSQSGKMFIGVAIAYLTAVLGR